MSSWIYLADGRVLEKGTPEHHEYLAEKNKQNGPLVFSDEPTFQSPIDRKWYSGKVGMREHNAKHNVENNRDLVGLPYMRIVEPYKEERPGAIKEAILAAAKRKGYMS
jgi:hypothetical protein